MNADDDDAADRAFEERARAELRRGADETPPELRARLDRMVDDVLGRPRRPRLLGFALPAAGAVVAGLLVAHRWQGTEAPSAPASEDLALLLNADLDLLEQMEFYQWLEREPDVLDEATASDSAQRS
jgi:hypothetical protein